MAVLFEVVDVDCEQADRSFFIPNVTMSAQSTTTFATVYGWSEFGTPSTPPKKYRTITVTGFSKRIAFTAEQSPNQCAGAEYVWDGVGQVDLKGRVVSKFTKKFFAQCNKQFWPPEPLQTLPGAINTASLGSTFVGFCWSQVTQSCPTCDPNEANWAFLGNQAQSQPESIQTDLGGFLHDPNSVVITSTSLALNDIFPAITSIVIPGESFTGTLFGTDSDNYTVTVGSRTYTGRAVVSDPPILQFPAVALNGGTGFIIGQYINFTDSNNHSAVLTDEYTDALALANADVVTGTGKVASNLPRTTGFTSVYTTVVFTLTCHNLISGRNYVVSVDFSDTTADVNPETGEHGLVVTTKQYPFTAASGSNIIIDAVPTPAAGHYIQVSNPRIAFA